MVVTHQEIHPGVPWYSIVEVLTLALLPASTTVLGRRVPVPTSNFPRHWSVHRRALNVSLEGEEHDVSAFGTRFGDILSDHEDMAWALQNCVGGLNWRY